MKGDDGKEGRIIGGSECPTVDRFDGKIEEWVGKHGYPSFRFHVLWYFVLLSPNEMKREHAQIGYENFDAPKYPVHDALLLVPSSSSFCSWFLLKQP